jgi:hypothetical protein
MTISVQVQYITSLIISSELHTWILLVTVWYVLKQLSTDILVSGCILCEKYEALWKFYCVKKINTEVS